MVEEGAMECLVGGAKPRFAWMFSFDWLIMIPNRSSGPSLMLAKSVIRKGLR